MVLLCACGLLQGQVLLAQLETTAELLFAGESPWWLLPVTKHERDQFISLIQNTIQERLLPNHPVE